MQFRLWMAEMIVGSGCAVVAAAGSTVMSVETYRDRLEGGVVGQMAGVSWGAATELQYRGQRIPDAAVPTWSAPMINDGFAQDDLYVEMPFLRAMNAAGPNATWSNYGDGFKSCPFRMWVANESGRTNLRNGLPVPDSGHPLQNPNYNAIDWQIESNFAGLLSPGLPTTAAGLAFRAGHVMTYGDGTYGGVAVAAMQSRAFTASSVSDIVAAGQQAIPAATAYRQMVDDVIAWHAADADKTTWTDTWDKIEAKWGPGVVGTWSKSLDAKLNSSYIFMGLLYGNGDVEHSMRIAMQCGQDSDCNPSSVGGILGAWVGLSGLPVKYTSSLDRTGRIFSDTEPGYVDPTSPNFTSAIAMSESLAELVLLARGGSVNGSGTGRTWTIPDEPAINVIREQWAGGDRPDLTAGAGDISGLTVNLTASATDSDGILGYQWFFGDMSFSPVNASGATSHTFAAPGTYEVIAAVADALGNTRYQAMSVTVVPEPGCMSVLVMGMAILARRRSRRT